MKFDKIEKWFKLKWWKDAWDAFLDFFSDRLNRAHPDVWIGPNFHYFFWLLSFLCSVILYFPILYFCSDAFWDLFSDRWNETDPEQTFFNPLFLLQNSAKIRAIHCVRDLTSWLTSLTNKIDMAAKKCPFSWPKGLEWANFIIISYYKKRPSKWPPSLAW